MVEITEEMVQKAAGMYGKNWDGPLDKRPGDKMKDVWRGYARDALEAVAPLIAKAENEDVATVLDVLESPSAGSFGLGYYAAIEDAQRLIRARHATPSTSSTPQPE